MKNVELINCPICTSNKITEIFNLNCGNIDDSTLYQTVKVNACDNCGHIYNKLYSNEINGLMKYYDKEYAPTNISATDKTGDRPGSNNYFTTERHSQLFKLISPYICNDSRILDIGCAMGGFLDYLRTNGLKNLSGIDLTENYVNYAKRKGFYNIKLGSAESIPFEDKLFDILFIDQVLEHSINPLKVFKEAKRVLVNDGLFCIGVPDSSRYDEIYFFDFYWFIMREHIQHFDIEHLKLLAEQEGFELVNYNKSETPMMSEKMILPNLSAVFRLTNKTNNLNISKECFNLHKQTLNYITNDLEQLNKKKKIINDLIKSQQPLYIWGIGREFLYLYESAGLKYCNIICLIDINPYKQKTFKIDKLKIQDKTVLEIASADTALIICAIAHSDAIRKDLIKSGYAGEIYEL